jgi:hypothetical protein
MTLPSTDAIDSPDAQFRLKDANYEPKSKEPAKSMLLSKETDGSVGNQKGLP